MSDNDKNSLPHNVSVQHQLIIDLRLLLTQETAAIANRNADLISHYAQTKLALIAQIEKQDRWLANLLQLDSAEKDNTLVEIEHIKALLTECKSINHINGMALNRAQLSMHKLHNLFQQAIHSHEITYDNEGQTSGQRTLGTDVKA